MTKTNLPIQVDQALAALEAAGYEAYIVGGALRDMLLHKEPGDYDITTSARPEQVLTICKNQGWQVVDNLGQNFGCVVAVIDHMALEITTFRGEAYGSDPHRPSEIYYCDSLREDLSRRDFTINALAMDRRGNIYDYYGGQEDLQAQVLRTVGTAKKRYQEDALRMFRACRFVSQLNFTYVQEEDQTPGFGQENSPYYLAPSFSFPTAKANGLSLERVRKEMDKLLLGKAPGKAMALLMATGLTAISCRQKVKGRVLQVPLLPELSHLVGLEQNPRFHCYNVWEHTLLALDNSPAHLAIRWAMVLHDIGKGLPHIRKPNKEGQPSDHGHERESAHMAKEILTRLGYSYNFVQLVVWLVAQHMRFAPMLVTGIKTLQRWVRAEAASGYFRSTEQLAEAYTLLVEVFLADMGATQARSNQQLMTEGRALGEQVIALAKAMPVGNGDLAIGGKDLLAIIPRPAIKEVLAYLLQRVQANTALNTRDVLLELALKHWERLTAKAEQEDNNA